MSITLERFDSHFHEDLQKLFLTISREGFAITLVGGAVRDFLSLNKLSNDLDFEIRHKFLFESDEWLDKIKRLGERLRDVYHYKVEFLNFSILRIKVGDSEIELSSPRLESFDLSETSFGHSDFDPIFKSNLSYEDSFRRRDFTLNAIGIEFGVTGSEDEFKLIDPYNGLADLENKLLRPINDDFYKDPVRYLRALRFKSLCNFEFCKELKDDIVYFNLERLSLFYFIQEGKKIGLQNLIKEMNFTQRKFSVKLPEWAKYFNRLEGIEEDLFTLQELLVESTAFLTSEEVVDFGKQLKLKKSFVLAAISISKIKKIDLNDLLKNLKENQFEDCISNTDLIELVKAKGLSKHLLSKYYDSLPDIILKIVENEIGGRKKYSELESKVDPKFRSILGIYCHMTSI